MQITTSANPPQTYLVTGGTGSFGSALSSHLLADPDGPRIRILSRDEHKQDDMQSACPAGPRLTYIIGDVRNSQTLDVAADGCAAIVHAAALKIVKQGEIHPDEFNMTNVEGTRNVVSAAIANRVPHSLFISSDKAVQPINNYGKSKAAAEGEFIQGNSKGVSRGCNFCIVRGGNVWESRGSVIDRWKAKTIEHASIYVTDPDVTRFYLSMQEWVSFCARVVREMRGGEIFIPKCRAWRLGDLARAYGNLYHVSGFRNGDKQHELLIAPDEIGRTVDIGWAYVIQPSADFRRVWNYQTWDGIPIESDWQYSSDRVERMSIEELRNIL